MKCSAKCKFYEVDLTSNGLKVYCSIRGLTIRDIKYRFPDTYLNCPKFQEVKGR